MKHSCSSFRNISIVLTDKRATNFVKRRVANRFFFCAHDAIQRPTKAQQPTDGERSASPSIAGSIKKALKSHRCSLVAKGPRSGMSSSVPYIILAHHTRTTQLHSSLINIKIVFIIIIIIIIVIAAISAFHFHSRFAF